MNAYYKIKSMQTQRHSVNALKIYRKEICKDLIVDYIIDHFVDTNVFTAEEADDIRQTGQEIGNVNDVMVRNEILELQNNTFMNELIKKLETTKDFAFNTFMYILFKDDNYPWIAKNLLAIVEEQNKSQDLIQKKQMNKVFMRYIEDKLKTTDNKYKNMCLLKRKAKLVAMDLLAQYLSSIVMWTGRCLAVPNSIPDKHILYDTNDGCIRIITKDRIIKCFKFINKKISEALITARNSYGLWPNVQLYEEQPNDTITMNFSDIFSILLNNSKSTQGLIATH
ncbi:uncharacterized protein LOC128960910 isoform X1 [Oppia nitens]|uniref:uncharacterized protein LOC128960910 isoform X1 n=1 Tax=Oppia nitens TaxID=1686743 RepID=UPI0023DADBAE|nr:uncharacterized protein LOC128960910 isoform X1 [Oppia nitens]